MIDLDYTSMRQIKDILRTHLPDTEIRIVGSRANGTAKPHSDVDLLIMNKVPLSPTIRALLNTAFEESAIPYKLDLLEDHDLTPEFRAGLIKQSVRMSRNEWKIHFAEFLDDLRRGLIPVTDKPLLFRNDKRLEALLASTVEAVCLEQNKSLPEWTQNVPCLDKPWFVSGMEGLKAMALVESPVFFRRRNIFVLNNFLSRA